MSNAVQQIIQRQDQILQAMGRIRTMERGTITRQSYPERAGRKNGFGAIGPYCLWQGTVRGKRFGKRVSGNEARRLEEKIAQRRAFGALCEEYVELSCRLAALERSGAASDDTLKKGLKSRLNEAGK